MYIYVYRCVCIYGRAFSAQAENAHQYICIYIHMDVHIYPYAFSAQALEEPQALRSHIYKRGLVSSVEV